MRYGVAIQPNRPADQTAGLAREAEQLGFDGLWLADHYFNRDLSISLALAAAATETIRLGTAVVSPFLRHPTLLASLTATITELAADRFVLGMGSGGYEFATQMDIDIPSPLGAVREATGIIRALLDGADPDAGTYFSAVGSSLRWQANPAKVHLAARGPRMLELAGEIGDGVITHGLSNRHVDFVRDRIGARIDDVEVCLMLDVVVGDSRRAALDELRPRCVTMAGGAYADTLIPIYGLDVDAVQHLRSLVRSGDRTAAEAAVTDQMADAFGLAGPPGHVREQLDRIDEQGVDTVILSVGGSDPEVVRSNLQTLAKVVVA